MSNEFVDFGIQLKKIREAAKESVEELSQAIEYDPKQLKKIENGEDRPSEDILALLISHFELSDQEAVRLWKLAGYITITTDEGLMDINDNPKNLVIGDDQKILYTDTVHVMSNKYGVVLNFVQGMGPDGKPIVVSRVGMSKEHAKSIIEVLQKTIDKQD